MSTDHLLIYCTCPDPATARRIADALVDRRLAACVNILPGLTSVYRWQGRVESADEALMMIKTTAPAYAAVEAAIQSLHPYELPEIIAVPLQAGLPGYLNWIDANVTPAS
jgi:periplasmic divalent cation tolerance protein